MKPLVYLAGGMEYATDGKTWRDEASEKLSSHGIKSWDPYVQEDIIFSEDTPISLIIKSLNKEKDFKKLRTIMNRIVSLDLDTVLEEASCLLVKYDASVLRGAGTHAEMSVATWAALPVHVWLYELTLNDLPSWAIGCISTVSYSLDGAISNIIRGLK